MLPRGLLTATLALSTIACSINPDPTLSEQQEFAIGRNMAAHAFKEFAVVDDPVVHEYVNLLGIYLARFSPRPMTFEDYTFLVIRDQRPNAFAGPSGFVFVTTGLLTTCENEDELAGVLAHEVSHVARKHPELAAASANERAAVAARIGTTTRIAQGLGSFSTWLLRLVGGTVRIPSSTAILQAGNDIVIQGRMLDRVTDDLLARARSGYDRELELVADADGVRLMSRAGFDPRQYLAFLQRLERVTGESGEGWSGTTHPPPGVRRMAIHTIRAEEAIDRDLHESRTVRFQRMRESLERILAAAA